MIPISSASLIDVKIRVLLNHHMIGHRIYEIGHKIQKQVRITSYSDNIYLPLYARSSHYDFSSLKLDLCDVSTLPQRSFQNFCKRVRKSQGYFWQRSCLKTMTAFSTIILVQDFLFSRYSKIQKLCWIKPILWVA